MIVISATTTEGLREFLGREDKVGCIAVVGRVGFVGGLDVLSATVVVRGEKSGGLHVWV